MKSDETIMLFGDLDTDNKLKGKLGMFRTFCKAMAAVMFNDPNLVTLVLLPFVNRTIPLKPTYDTTLQICTK